MKIYSSKSEVQSLNYNDKMFVNHTHQGYPEKRNFLYSSKVRFSQTIDLFKIISHLSFKLANKIPVWALNLYYNPLKKKNTTLHFFNGISLSPQKWISTFETALPRLSGAPKWLVNKAAKQLAADNCIRLIALSDCTYQIQKQYLNQNYPRYAETILAKTIVLHPPQACLIEKKNNQKTSPIAFTFIGNQFFGKGGREVLSVFSKLHEEGFSFQLNIISNLSPDSYASHTTHADVAKLKSELAQLPSSIIMLGSLPNTKVIELLKKSDVALLPTYADTYGYSVLEAQTCGCPVISTDIRALPEINNNDCGWIIKVPKDELGNGLLKTKEERMVFSQTIEKGLYKIVKEILTHPDNIKAKGAKALARIKEHHDPEKHAQRLLEIYQQGMKRNTQILNTPNPLKGA